MTRARVLVLGRNAARDEVTADLSFKDGRFSASFASWNGKSGTRRDAATCGQFDPREEIASYSIPRERVDRLVSLWQRWHLNNMRAGCAHQRAEEWEKRPIDPTKPLNAYGKFFPGQACDSWNMLTWIPRREHPAGLLSFPCQTCGYKFGSAWLTEEIPPETIREIEEFFS